jgi:hypothetical protein
VNFLQLCQRVSFESGQQGSGPADVVNQIGILADIVRWTADSWNEIQAEKDWNFLHATKTITLAVNVQSYSIFGTNPGDLNWQDLRWIDLVAKVIVTKTNGAGKYFLNFLPWPKWRARYGLVTNWAVGPPAYFTWAPGDILIVDSLPDDTHTIEFPYWTIAQVLAAQNDIPSAIRPELHMVIVWRAVQKFLAKKESARYQNAVQQEGPLYHRLMRYYLPPIEVGPSPITHVPNYNPPDSAYGKPY